MVPRAAVVAVCCLLLVTTPLGVAVGAAQSAGDTGGADRATDSPDRCFPEEGYEFTIGTEGPEIDVVIHMSLLTNLGGPGAVGVELSGTIGGPPIIDLKTGVRFGGIDSVMGFLNDPFGHFSIIYDYRFDLPMLGGDFSYDDSESPVDGPVSEC